MLHEGIYVVLKNGYALEKNKVGLYSIQRVGTLASYQVHSERYGKTYSELFRELDPAIAKFVELSS
jgi:hypothetical protein